MNSITSITSDFETLSNNKDPTKILFKSQIDLNILHQILIIWTQELISCYCPKMWTTGTWWFKRVR